MPFIEPSIHGVKDISAWVVEYPRADGSRFAALHLAFTQRNGGAPEMTAFFDGKDAERARAIAAAITLSQSPLADASE